MEELTYEEDCISTKTTKSNKLYSCEWCAKGFSKKGRLTSHKKKCKPKVKEIPKKDSVEEVKTNRRSGLKNLPPVCYDDLPSIGEIELVSLQSDDDTYE